MPEDSLTLANLQELYERIQRECPPPDRYELRVHSLGELEHALHAIGTCFAALEASGIKGRVSEFIPPWKGVLFNITAWNRATNNYAMGRISVGEWKERSNLCIWIVDLAEPSATLGG